MRLRFTRLKKSPYIFKQLTGLGVVEFEKVIEKVIKGWGKMEGDKKATRPQLPLAYIRR